MGLRNEAMNREEQFQSLIKISNEAISVETSQREKQLKTLNEDFHLKLDETRKMVRLSLQRESDESRKCLQTQKLEHLAGSEENTVLSKASLNELTELVKLEQAKCHQAIEEQMKSFKQLLEVGFMDLNEKENAFWAETSDGMLRLWNAIKMHDVCMDDVVDMVNSLHAKEQSGSRCQTPLKIMCSPVSRATSPVSRATRQHEVAFASPSESLLNDLQVKVARVRSVSPTLKGHVPRPTVRVIAGVGASGNFTNCSPSPKITSARPVFIPPLSSRFLDKPASTCPGWADRNPYQQ